VKGSLSGRYAIVGVGESDVGKKLGRTELSLHLEAATRALTDAGVQKTSVDGVMTRPTMVEPQFNYSASLAARLGIQPTYIADIAMSGASSVAMVLNAVAALEAGFCTTVLCVNGDVQTREGRSRGGLTSIVEDFEKPFGMLGAPVTYGLPARRHMYEYGTTSKQFGEVAVACRMHASLNPNAVYRTPITIEDHQTSRMVVDPFRLLDICPRTDGAGAVLVTSAERARELAQPPVYLLGLGEFNTHADVQYAPSMTSIAMRQASQQAYEMAKLHPDDIDVAELYDCFTSVVIATLEDYGFCQKGEGGPFVEDGRIRLGGQLPVNTGGGLLSQAHASGFLHITEAATQMRGQAGDRQVIGAETAIVSGQCGALGINACMILGKHVN